MTFQQINYFKMKKNLIIIISTLLISACSASYEKLKNIENSNENTLKNHLLNAYKEKAKFEAEEMHDWNSAKLFSEKALFALDGREIKPQEIDYWKLPESSIAELKVSNNNLLKIYDKAKKIDPYNLAVAVSSLDCWAEQQEENWQTDHIKKCKNDYLQSMHIIYEKIIDKTKNNSEYSEKLSTNPNSESVTIIKKNKRNEILEIIYFDFDKSKLSDVSIKEIKNFLTKYKSKTNKYMVVGHSDRKGSNEYNLKLSLKRAEAVKKILILEGIDQEKIKVLGKGELFPVVPTKNDVSHPANRRVEISLN